MSITFSSMFTSMLIINVQIKLFRIVWRHLVNISYLIPWNQLESVLEIVRVLAIEDIDSTNQMFVAKFEVGTSTASTNLFTYSYNYSGEDIGKISRYL